MPASLGAAARSGTAPRARTRRHRTVHLRLCRTCGHVGCCDSSPNRHATLRFREASHPIVQSFEPGEDWAWCYVDRIVLVLG